MQQPSRRSKVLTMLVAVCAAGITAFAAIVPVANTAAGAASLAAAIESTPGVITGASFDTVTGGTPHAVADAPLSSFPTAGGTFAILTSGNAQLADDPNVAIDSGTDNGGGAVRGDTDFDVTVLKVDLNVPATANCLTLDFKFYSEEYPEWVGNIYNDAFIAELDSSTWSTSGSTISAPNNFAFDPSGDVISINSTGATAMSAAQAAGTTYDGATPLLSASTQITPGAHSLYLSIFDQGDAILDSAVFLDNLVVGFVPDPETNCVPGAQPKLYTMTLTPVEDNNPEHTDHTVTATLLEQGTALPGATITFNVTGANPGSGAGVTDAAGQATFTWSGDEGDDIVSACYDADGNGSCEAVASAIKHWLHVNQLPAAGCTPTTNPAGVNEPGANASASAGMNPDGFYLVSALDSDDPAPQVYVGDTESSFVAGPFAAGTKIKVTEANGVAPRVRMIAGGTVAHVMLNGDARVYAVDNEGGVSADQVCYVPRPPK
jgi:hypothetical protein